MKQHIFTLLLLLIASFIFGQPTYLPIRPYEPIKFTNIQPVWYDTIIDTTENNEEGNGYNLLNFTLRCKPEIRDNYLYSSYQTSYKGDVSGTYLEKRDISTGNVEWKYIYGHKEVDRPEVARSIIFEQDSVRLLSWRSKDTLGIWPPFSIAGIGVTMTERSFSDTSGHLGTYLTTMPGDTTAKKFTANPIFVNKVEYILKDPHTDGYRCIYHEVFTNPQYILSVPLDRYGRQIGQTDTVICDRLKTFFVNTINGGKVLLNKRDGEKMFMVIYSDASLNHQEDFWELESFDVEGPTILLAIDGDNTIWSHSPNSDNEVISVYHRDKLVSKVAIPVEYHYNSFTFVNSKPIGIIGYDKVSNKQDIVIIEDNQFELVKSLISEDSLRYMLIWDITKYDNLLLIHSEEGSWALNQVGKRILDYPSKANSIIAFSLESLGLVSSTSDAHQIKGNMDVYPNPSENVIHIKVHSKFTKNIEVRNMLGNVMKKIYPQDINVQTLDISNWPSGMYIITGDNMKPKTFIKI